MTFTEIKNKNSLRNVQLFFQSVKIYSNVYVKTPLNFLEGGLNVKFGQIKPNIIASVGDFEYALSDSLIYENNCPAISYLGSLLFQYFSVF